MTEIKKKRKLFMTKGNSRHVLTSRKGKAAFTLAEVLITLAIIGVVAAMTLPTLILKHQKQQWVTGLQNAYSTISNGFNLMKTQEGTGNLYDTEFFNGSHHCLETLYSGALSNEELEACSNILKQYFKIVDYKNYDFYEKSDSVLYEFKVPAFILNNGIALSITPEFIFVDVNGNKKPNQYGRDKFVLQYFDNGKIIGNIAFSTNDLTNGYLAMTEDVYIQVVMMIKGGTPLVCDDGPVCSLGQILDSEVKKATFQALPYTYPDIECDDFNNFWSCMLNYAPKLCPSEDGGTFCAARIMADGWKMNY